MTVDCVLKKKPKDLRPDLLNIGMTIADLLQGSKKRKPILYDDDAQLVEVHLFKSYGTHPMTRVVVEEIGEGT
jgi:Holliday junction resolvase RusA-like endonuclease